MAASLDRKDRPSECRNRQSGPADADAHRSRIIGDGASAVNLAVGAARRAVNHFLAVSGACGDLAVPLEA